ncbi:MAG: hypothetical protein CL923_05755, partial [Deltaproteobacteria bacterium]|nr:hypothetical protein [Deltaproteobacteria bacterium]
MSWDKNPPLEPVFALDTLRNRVNTILKSNQKRNNTQEGDHLIFNKAHIGKQVKCALVARSGAPVLTP